MQSKRKWEEKVRAERAANKKKAAAAKFGVAYDEGAIFVDDPHTITLQPVLEGPTYHHGAEMGEFVKQFGIWADGFQIAVHEVAQKAEGLVKAFTLSSKPALSFHLPVSDNNSDARIRLAKMCPALESTENIRACPSGCSYSEVIGGLIIHLNDHHHWTREHIAVWLRELNIDLTVRPEKENDYEQAAAEAAVLPGFVWTGTVSTDDNFTITVPPVPAS